MTDDAPAGLRIRGSLHAADAGGSVRVDVLLPADVEAVWAALTDGARLAQWLGELDGDLRPGGRVQARFFATGWEGTITVQVCERPVRLQLLTESSGEPDCVMSVTLGPEGEQTALAFEDSGLPLDQLAAYGAGDQVLVEDLAAYLAGRGRADARARWQELHPQYRERAAALEG